MTTVKCKRCKQDTNTLEVFPGGICLRCYEQTEGKRPLTEQDFRDMVDTFKGNHIRRTKHKVTTLKRDPS